MRKLLGIILILSITVAALGTVSLAGSDQYYFGNISYNDYHEFPVRLMYHPNVFYWIRNTSCAINVAFVDHQSRIYNGWTHINGYRYTAYANQGSTWVGGAHDNLNPDNYCSGYFRSWMSNNFNTDGSRAPIYYPSNSFTFGSSD